MNDIQRLFNSFEGKSDTYREIRKEEKQEAARHTWSLLEGIGRLSRDRTEERTEPAVRQSAVPTELPSRSQNSPAGSPEGNQPGGNLRREGISSIPIPKSTVKVIQDNRPEVSPVSAAVGGETADSLATVFKRLKKAAPPAQELSLRSMFQKLIR